MTIDKQNYTIGDRECTVYSSGIPRLLLVQVVSERQGEDMDKEVEQIAAATNIPFALVAVPIVDWELELMPWAEQVVSRRPEVGSGAVVTLRYITDHVLPALPLHDIPTVLGGYSLGGLFAMWAACQTAVFKAVAAASPSLWAGDWPQYSDSHPMLAKQVYLSLGDREEYTRNKTMARSGDRLRAEHARLQAQLGANRTTLVWEQGGHFNNPAGRMAKAFSWTIEQLKDGIAQ